MASENYSYSPNANGLSKQFKIIIQLKKIISQKLEFTWKLNKQQKSIFECRAGHRKWKVDLGFIQTYGKLGFNWN